MYKNDKYDVEVNINLDNGIYVFDEKSATGKTRLCKVLKELRKLGEPVIGYTYGDDNLGISLIDITNKVNPKVLMLDRYDMYNGTFNNELAEWSKNAVILIDCKGDLETKTYTDRCTIEMGPREIEVVQ